MPKGGGRGQKEMDPEKEMKRKFRAKCLFRALGRKVMANAYWLIEDVDEYVGVDDVKRRVEQAVQKKTKTQQLLSIRDKALLNKPAAERAENEKRYLYKKLGGLKCFKQYPHHVRRKLAGVMYYRYYGPGRVIVRQHQEAHAMYFIVSGEITLSVLEYDEVLNEDVSRETDKMDAGSVVGDFALLHNMPHLETATTSDHCELLMLFKEDFNNILFTSVQQQWDEVYNAMSFFSYFNDLDAVARREGCIVAKMLSYKIDDTLLGDGCGVPNMAYFMLSGHCQMIESVQVLETRFLSSVSYMLYDPQASEVKSRHHDICSDSTEQKLDSKHEVVDLNNRMSNSTASRTILSGKIERNDSSAAESEQACTMKEKKHSILRSSIKVSQPSELVQEGGVKKVSINIRASESKLILDPHEEDPARGRPSVRLSVTPNYIKEPKPKNLKTYFMQVCIFNKGSCFGFGENMRDRRMVALTPVECLLLPSVWLMRHNTANIWTRIRHYLDKKIPTKKQLFKEFVMSRRWLEHRDQVLTDVLASANPVNWTTEHDVPYSIRMEEMIE